jgi:hypothetical protein
VALYPKGTDGLVGGGHSLGAQVQHPAHWPAARPTGSLNLIPSEVIDLPATERAIRMYIVGFDQLNVAAFEAKGCCHPAWNKN